MSLPVCPQCSENFTYEDGNLLICPMCGHEWTQAEMDQAAEAAIVRDVNGNPLADGDTVTIVKDLKLSATNVIKQGAKAKGLRILMDPVDGHDLEGKIDSVGKVYLKSSVVKK